jgi:hypothetical protein
LRRSIVGLLGTRPITPRRQHIRTGTACGFLRSENVVGFSEVPDQDIEDFYACIAGNCCATCGSPDFNHDGDSGTDADIEAFFRVLGGGPC